MNVTPIQAVPPPDQATEQIGVPAAAAYDSCEECGSAVDREQRYCVACGVRRKHVYDPAARFLSGATSRSRAGAGKPAAGARPVAARPRRFQSVGTALAIAVIPIAIALGVVLGKGTNNTDAKLLSALQNQKPEVVNVGGGAAGTGSATTASTDIKSHAAKSAKSSSGSKKVLAKTSNGSFTSLTSQQPPSQAQLNQNAQIVKRVQSTINQGYVNSQKNLPNSIAVP